jgi:hypothetical protein
MKTNGIVIYATAEAEKKYKGKNTAKKNKKISCPSCELQLRNRANFINETIKEDILKENN